MRFAKLTNEDGTVLYVNARHVIGVQASEENPYRTDVDISDGNHYSVRETVPQAVAALEVAGL